MEGLAAHGSTALSSLIGLHGIYLEYSLKILNPNLL
jgi:hypothetical protein